MTEKMGDRKDILSTPHGGALRFFTESEGLHEQAISENDLGFL
jgi:hypothetical protein